MAEKGQLGRGDELSVDRRKWTKASLVKGLVFAEQGAEPPDVSVAATSMPRDVADVSRRWIASRRQGKRQTGDVETLDAEVITEHGEEVMSDDTWLHGRGEEPTADNTNVAAEAGSAMLGMIVVMMGGAAILLALSMALTGGNIITLAASLVPGVLGAALIRMAFVG